MSLKKLEINKISELFNLNLKIPEYQRPYRWSGNSTNRLFSDIYKGYKSNIDEYRIGSIILHKDKSGDYNVVDGQQRITTLLILRYGLSEKEEDLLEIKYNSLSEKAIIEANRLLKMRILELKEQEKKGVLNYLLEKCTVVKIVTDSEQEAFQFFDSQNSRGKALEPHDLLKSYHLREMNRENEELKIKIIDNWEKREDLKELFEVNLYPLIKWYRGKRGLNYSVKEIHEFKGIKSNSKYTYATRIKATNLAIEKINQDGVLEVLGQDEISQFQLTEKLIAGKRFFLYVEHYGKMKDKVVEMVNGIYKEKGIVIKGKGDRYVKNLYINVGLFFADRFGINEIDKIILKRLYLWSYSIRIMMQLVYKETINKYALGNHEINENLNIFEKINEMDNPKEINSIELEPVKRCKSKINEVIEKDFKEAGLKGWE